MGVSQKESAGRSKTSEQAEAAGQARLLITYSACGERLVGGRAAHSVASGGGENEAISEIPALKWVASEGGSMTQTRFALMLSMFLVQRGRRLRVPTSRARVGIVSLLVSVASVLCFVPPASGEDGCNIHRVRGNYVYRDLWVNWQSTGAGQETHSAIVLFSFDGKGTFSFAGTARKVDQNGTLTTTSLTGSGTYVVNPDCTMTIAIPGADGGGLSTLVALDGRIFLATGVPDGLQGNENMLGIGVQQ